MGSRVYDGKPYLLRDNYVTGDQRENNEFDSVPFRPMLEQSIHDTIHTWIGARAQGVWGMGSLASPNDPIFYLHHCNLDRVWAKWQRVRGKNNYVPDSNGPPRHNLGDTMQGLPENSTFKTPAEVLDYEAKLDYSYDDVYADHHARASQAQPHHPAQPTTPVAVVTATPALKNEGKILNKKAIEVMRHFVWQR